MENKLMLPGEKEVGGGDKMGFEVDTAVYQISTGNRPQ